MTLNFDLARRTRRFKDLTQEQLAQRIGVTKDALAGWEQGQHEPTLSNAVAWARALGLKLTDLVPDAEAGQVGMAEVAATSPAATPPSQSAGRSA